MKNKWTSPQSIIILITVILIFAYILFDAISVKPQIKEEIDSVKQQYVELSEFLDKKIPEIDSTFKIHANQIEEQRQQMSELEEAFYGFN